MSRFSRVTGHPIIGRGDLVEAIATGDDAVLEAVALQLGLTHRVRRQQVQEILSHAPTVRIESPKLDSSTYPSGIEDIAVWRVGARSAAKPLPEIPEGPEYIEWNDQLANPIDPPKHSVLAPWSYVGARLRRDLTSVRRTGALDISKLISQFAQRKVVIHFPRKTKRRWGARFQIIKDESFRLSPYQSDHQMVIDQLLQLIPHEKLEIAIGDGPFDLSICSLEQDTDLQQYELPSPGSHVLVLSDLGRLARSTVASREWMQWGRIVVQRGCRLQALVPCSEAELSPSLRQLFSIQTWERHSVSRADDANRDELVEQLLVLASPALRIEAGLLRDLRKLIPGADASIEALFWRHEWLSSNHPAAATIDYRKANQFLRPKFEQLAPEVRKKALECIRRWRVRMQGSPEIWLEEVLGLSESSRKLVSRWDLEDAYACVRRIDRLRKSDGVNQSSYQAYMSRLTQRSSQSALSDATIGRILRNAKRELHPKSRGVVTGTDPRELPAGELREFSVNAFDNELLVAANGLKNALAKAPSVVNQPICGHLLASNSSLTIEIEHYESLSERRFWKSGVKPECVSAFGSDQYGAWFEFEVRRNDGKGVATQRMRWIRGGSFLMGSPENEPGRWEDEGPQHLVTLTKGFWLADTPCTQELWIAVTGQNPSHFKGERLPVETVSWTEAWNYLKELAHIVQGLEPILPTEAQWEHACRAGTNTAYCFGDELTPDQANFEGKTGKTTDVGSYRANRWGLYDVHGNVWEWCLDDRRTYHSSATTDPLGKGSSRVVRGGSWGLHARGVRSACRGRSDPGDRGSSLGFRLLSSAVAEPTEFAEVPVAEQGSEQTRVGVAENLRAISIRVSDSEPTQLEVDKPARIRVISNLESIDLQRLEKPNWAVEFGRDPFGVYGDFQIDSIQDDKPVRQRLRWIPPGSFQMGSPADEPARRDNETLHQVTLTNGFWMFDAPCSQRLWMAVMGDNPSYFPDPDRPVEQVDWEQSQLFAKQLSERLSLKFNLPTEAQWEYACRAGTSTAIYTGPLEILGDANAPALDEIGWYGGNSGYKYDLEKWYDVSKFTWIANKQYPFDKAGTRKSKQKLPNPWGLYDMLGNVWEWCEDWYSEYFNAATTDPTGATTGSFRVVRGGGWFSNARSVRSACRDRRDPGLRINVLGFRLLSSDSGSPSQAPSERVGSRSQPRDEGDENQRTK